MQSSKHLPRSSLAAGEGTLREANGGRRRRTFPKPVREKPHGPVGAFYAGMGCLGVVLGEGGEGVL